MGKRTHESPIHSWNLIVPSVLSAVKSGAMVPSRKFMAEQRFQGFQNVEIKATDEIGL